VIGSRESRSLKNQFPQLFVTIDMGLLAIVVPAQQPTIWHLASTILSGQVSGESPNN
jgi:hypothetical protein